MRLMVRVAFLLEPPPSDVAVWKEFCSTLTGRFPGKPLIASVLSWLVIAHAVKWPPAVRFLHSVLAPNLEDLETRTTAATIVGTVRGVIQCCNGEKWETMHAAMSSGRMHPSTGMIPFAERLGLLIRTNNAASSQDDDQPSG